MNYKIESDLVFIISDINIIDIDKIKYILNWIPEDRIFSTPFITVTKDITNNGRYLTFRISNVSNLDRDDLLKSLELI